MTTAAVADPAPAPLMPPVPRLARLLWLAIAAAAWGSVVVAVGLQHLAALDPCPMCILQRYAYAGLTLLFLAGALHGPARRGARIYSGLIIVVAAAGAAVAARQVWLQHLPADQVPACGPGLDYLMRKFPLYDVLEKVFAGSGECAEVGWRFLGLSIAGWSLVWFVLLALLATYAAVRARPGGAPA